MKLAAQNGRSLLKAGRKSRGLVLKRTSVSANSHKGLLADIREIIHAARSQVAQAVNAGLTLLYWQVGQRIHRDILNERRADYGEKIVASVSRQLEKEFGRGFAEKNVRRMVQFAEEFPEQKIVVSLIRQLSWTHFLKLIPIEDPLKRDFYAEMCRLERWSVRTLADKISGMLYERTALSKKPASIVKQELKELREKDKLSPDFVFRDPYVLDFLQLRDTYNERDLESAILREIERFLLELGVGFCFVERQKRMVIDSRDYYLDLLFFHRKLRRLIAVDLKLGEFDAADKGQMELYLNWLKKHEHADDEEAPLGIILCAGKRQEHVELLEMHRSGIHVASYVIKEIPKKQLEQKLHQAIRLAREKLERSAT